MLQHLPLQAEAGAALAAIVVSVIICSLFYGLQRRSVSKIKEAVQPLRALDPKIQYDVARIEEKLKTTSEHLDATCEHLTNLRADTPSTNEVAMVRDNMQNICTEFSELKAHIGNEITGFKHSTNSDIDVFKRVTAEDFDKTRREMISSLGESMIERAEEILVKKSVSKEEFDILKNRIEKIAGSDEVAERMGVLTSLFDSKQIKTLNWQCKLIKLLNGGLAPDAEEDRIVSEGIPMSSYNKFLKRLESSGVAEHKTVSAFYMAPDYEWLYAYVDNPDRLQKLLEGTIRKEKEYQEYVRANLDLVEAGLLLESSEYELATGKIDLLCRDGSGKPVGMELKYPEAAVDVKRQISGYRDDYLKKTGAEGARFIVVAPKIPDKLKEMLREDDLEYREIQFRD